MSPLIPSFDSFDSPPPLIPQAVRSIPKMDSDRGITHEIDPDFLEHLHREETEPPELPWDP